VVVGADIAVLVMMIPSSLVIVKTVAAAAL
jgi:hypothetical protein